MRVLIVSPFIDPEAVGEPRWCYELAKGLSDRVESIIVAQQPTRSSKRLAELFPNSTVHAMEGWRFQWMKPRLRHLMKPAYIPYYRFARRIIGEHYPPGSVACAHQFGPLALRYPSPLRNSGIPYLIGPLGGSLRLPAGFGETSRKEPWYYRLRDFDNFRIRHDPMLRDTYRRAECVIGIGDYVLDILGRDLPQRFATFTETTAPTPPFDIEQRLVRRKHRTDSVRFLIVSRQIFSKGIHLALRALAQASSSMSQWRLDILGEGPYKPVLQALSGSLGIADRVTFHGHVTRDQVNLFYDDADIFLFPSIREPSGVVMFEAMSWGLPMIVADYGGPAVHADDSFAIRIPVTSPETFVQEMAGAVTKLAQGAERRQDMGRCALKFVRERYNLNAMVDFYVQLYGSISRDGSEAQA